MAAAAVECNRGDGSTVGAPASALGFGGARFSGIHQKALVWELTRAALGQWLAKDTSLRCWIRAAHPLRSMDHGRACTVLCVRFYTNAAPFVKRHQNFNQVPTFTCWEPEDEPRYETIRLRRLLPAMPSPAFVEHVGRRYARFDPLYCLKSYTNILSILTGTMIISTTKPRSALTPQGRRAGEQSPILGAKLLRRDPQYLTCSVL